MLTVSIDDIAVMSSAKCDGSSNAVRRSDRLEASQQQARGETCTSYDGGGV